MTIWEMRFTKWDGSAHWHFQVEPLGSDAHGAWFMGPPETVLQRANEPPITEVDGFAMLVPSTGDWIAFWNRADEPAVYVDVTAAPRLSNGRIDAVDLDLDVFRLQDGRVEVADVDEFEAHQATFAYPTDVVRRAEDTANELVARVRAGDPPFDDTGAEWLARAAAQWGAIAG